MADNGTFFQANTNTSNKGGQPNERTPLQGAGNDSPGRGGAQPLTPKVAPLDSLQVALQERSTAEALFRGSIPTL